MKIIVTGATGSLGAAIVKYFSAKGHDIIACGRTNPPRALLDCAEYIKADITQAFTLPAADVCIHSAALSDDKALLKDLLVANETGTVNTLNAASKCEMFIHISSSSVYLPAPEKLKEEQAGKQNNKQLSAYGLSKLRTEAALGKHISIPSCYVLRPRALYGPCDKMILPRLLKLEKNGIIQHPGSMRNRVSMTHYDNLNHAIECCIKDRRDGIYTYNVADDEEYLFMDVVRKLTKTLFGKTLPEKQIPIIIPKLMSVFKIGGITKLLVRSFTKDMVLDISSIKEELDYNPRMNLEASLPGIKAWINSIGGLDILRTGSRELPWQ